MTRPNDAGHVIAEAPVRICQLETEFERALKLYREVKPMRVLEIGTAEGGSLYHWLRNAQAGAQVVTVDLADADYPGNDHLYPDWTPDGVTVTQIRGNTHDPETLEACRALGPYQWLFIDASHTYDDARADWNDYMPLVDDGFVLLHDIGLRRKYEDGTEAGVWMLWREIQAKGYMTAEIREDPSFYAYGIGCVRVDNR